MQAPVARVREQQQRQCQRQCLCVTASLGSVSSAAPTAAWSLLLGPPSNLAACRLPLRVCAYSSSGSQQVCGLCEESGGVLGCAGGHAVVDNRSGACVRCDVVTVLSSHADIRCVI